MVKMVTFFFNMYSYLRRFVPYSWIVFIFLLQLSSCTRVFTRTKVFVSKRKSSSTTLRMLKIFSAAFDSCTPSTRIALILLESTQTTAKVCICQTQRCTLSTKRQTVAPKGSHPEGKQLNK
uniref:(northern house mosquito) hypothetical protein n=1 Tax=Culex pipiens TaxID=7175 RepID=A0A8D8GQ69_CULPI